MQFTKNSKRTVEVIRPDDAMSTEWAVSTAKKFREELGGVHSGTLAAHVALGCVVRCVEDGQNLGVLCAKKELKSDLRVVPIIAAAVPSDLQRLHVGLTMLDAVASTFQLDRFRVFQAVCREDLPSNRFWAAAGFLPIAVRHTASQRAKPLIIWRRCVNRIVIGVERYEKPARERGGGARWLPKDRPDLAEVLDFTEAGIAHALMQSGARPMVAQWTGHDWDRTADTARPTIERPTRPNHPQTLLFANAGKPAMLDGR